MALLRPRDSPHSGSGQRLGKSAGMSPTFGRSGHMEALLFLMTLESLFHVLSKKEKGAERGNH